MAILLELSADVEARLTDKAAGDGMPVAKYVEKLVEEKVGGADPRRKSPEEIRAALMSFVEDMRQIPTIEHGSAIPAIEFDDLGLSI
jgi:hypothetical protein